jgi:hypothetical protein
MNHRHHHRRCRAAGRLRLPDRLPVAAVALVMSGSVCDRCGTPYLAPQFPSIMLCPSCYLGAMTPAERGRLLTHLDKTGKRVA